MAHRAATGGNVGQMFVTDPQKTEFDLYKEARAEREAKERADAAAKIAAAARAQAAASAAKPSATAAAP